MKFVISIMSDGEGQTTCIKKGMNLRQRDSSEYHIAPPGVRSVKGERTADAVILDGKERKSREGTVFHEK